jgi:MFS family permease
LYYVGNKDGIKSAASDYGPFMCDDEYLLDLIKSCPYFGSLVGYFLSSFIAGNIGRKKLMTIALGISSLGSVLVVTAFNLPMVVIGVIFSGMGINVACGMAFCYLAETVEDNKRQKYSILVQISFTIGTMLVTGFYASIADWRIISIILQAIPVIATFLLYAFYA